MYTRQALNDTKLSEVKQMAANLGITTVQDNRRKHLWVAAILAAQEVAPLLPQEFVVTIPPEKSPVPTPEPDEEDDDDEDETWEEDSQEEDDEEDYPEEKFFSEPDDSFIYKDWLVFVDDGEISYLDPKTGEWDNWVYDSHIDDAIKELERHIDRVEFDRAIPPGQLELHLFPTSDVQSANVSDSDTWEVAPLLVAEFREACCAIALATPSVATERGAIELKFSARFLNWDKERCIDATEQSAIVLAPGAATELERVLASIDATEQSAIALAPGAATESEAIASTTPNIATESEAIASTTLNVATELCAIASTTPNIATEPEAIVLATPSVATERGAIKLKFLARFFNWDKKRCIDATERGAIAFAKSVATERGAINSTPGAATELGAIISTTLNVATEPGAIASTTPNIATEPQIQEPCYRCKGKGFIREDTSAYIHFWRCELCDSTGLISSPPSTTHTRSPPGVTCE